MKVIYKNKKAKEQFCSKYKSKWKYPKEIEIGLESAENFIYAASSLEDIRSRKSFNLEHLQGNHKDEWSIRINNKYRILFIPCDDNEKPITKGDILGQCKVIKIILVTEVSNHYG